MMHLPDNLAALKTISDRSEVSGSQIESLVKLQKLQKNTGQISLCWGVAAVDSG